MAGPALRVPWDWADAASALRWALLTPDPAGPSPPLGHGVSISLPPGRFGSSALLLRVNPPADPLLILCGRREDAGQPETRGLGLALSGRKCSGLGCTGVENPAPRPDTPSRDPRVTQAACRAPAEMRHPSLGLCVRRTVLAGAGQTRRQGSASPWKQEALAHGGHADLGPSHAGTRRRHRCTGTPRPRPSQNQPCRPRAMRRRRPRPRWDPRGRCPLGSGPYLERPAENHTHRGPQGPPGDPLLPLPVTVTLFWGAALGHGGG